jgi:predicted permease
VTAILGEEWVIYASAFMVVQQFIIWTHGKSLIQGKTGADFKAILLNVNLIACVAGMIMFLLHLHLPSLLGGTVKSMASVIGPVSMIMIGMILAGTDLKSIVKGKRIWIIAVLKMIIIPMIILVIMKYSGFSRFAADGVTILYISLMATMTPSASTVTQMAQLYDQDAGTATAINTITTLMCIATMPLLTMIYYL